MGRFFFLFFFFTTHTEHFSVYSVHKSFFFKCVGIFLKHCHSTSSDFEKNY